MTTTKWVTQREAADHLRLSERTLIRLRRDGLLAAGECWHRKITTNANSHVLYHLAACEDALCVATRAAYLEQDQLGHRAMEVAFA